MKLVLRSALAGALLAALLPAAVRAGDDREDRGRRNHRESTQLGPRPSRGT